MFDTRVCGSATRRTIGPRQPLRSEEDAIRHRLAAEALQVAVEPGLDVRQEQVVSRRGERRRRVPVEAEVERARALEALERDRRLLDPEQEVAPAPAP